MRDFVFTEIAARAIPCLMVSHDIADAPAGGRVLRLEDGMVRHA